MYPYMQNGFVNQPQFIQPNNFIPQNNMDRINRQIEDLNNYKMQMQQNIPQPIPQPIPQQNNFLQGKLVDSIDVVKATEISLDGTKNYFPLTNGSAIITKQLLGDGTCKILVYKPVVDDVSTTNDSRKENELNNKIKYVTQEQLQEELGKIDLSDLDKIKKAIKDLESQISKLQGGSKK